MEGNNCFVRQNSTETQGAIMDAAFFIYICGRRRYKDMSCSFHERLQAAASRAAQAVCSAEQRHRNCSVCSTLIIVSGCHPAQFNSVKID